MKYLFPFVFLCLFQSLQAQEWLQKVSPNLRQTLYQRASQDQLFTLVVSDLTAFQQFLQEKKIAVRILQTYAPAKIVVIRTTATLLLTQLLPNRSVLFADLSERHPQEELSVSGLDLSLNKINIAHRLFPAINGAGLTVSIKEERFDDQDIDLIGRYGLSPQASTRTSTHASIMATMLGGAGNSFYNGKGAAWGATLTSANFSNLLPENDYKELNISVQNHSYGVGIENYYGAEAVAYDASVQEQPELLHIFSAGNRGDQASETGKYKSLNQAANLTGTFKMAKNVLTVGSLDLTNGIPLLSSKGPAYDGRVKPELVALGQDGSSGAAALTSGVALLVQQAFLEKHRHSPAAALVKAILINSADDVGAPGIDFQSGYGSLNAARALQTVQESQFIESSIQKGDTLNYSFTVSENARNLKVTLVWSDNPANVNAERALQNDIDLELQKANEIWLPWVLNAAPHLDSLNLPPIRKKDHLNNVEQITIEYPASGTYTVFINAFELQTPEQAFYIAYQWDTTDTFQWIFPTQNDPVEAGETQFLRWGTTMPDTLARLEYALDGGNWQLLSDTVSLSKHYFIWQAPETFSSAQLRMTIGNPAFISDTFMIAPAIKIEVGFNCDNQFLLYWNKMPGAQSYQLYRLGNSYLEPLPITIDTFALFDKAQNPALWYAVAPLNTTNRTGIRSYATNYTTQGVDCYLKNFLTNLIDGKTAELLVSIGATLHLKSIRFEKASKGIFATLQSFAAANQLEWKLLDTNLKPGINTYRVVIELQDGEIIYSNPSSVYYAGSEGYWLFPNPVQRGQEVLLIAEDISEKEVRMFDTLGREVQRQPLSSEIEALSIGNLATGVYQVAILKKGELLRQFKMVVVN